MSDMPEFDRAAIKAFYDALSPSDVQACEQFYADAKHDFNNFSVNVLKDLNLREAEIGIHDDSVQFAMCHWLLTTLILNLPPQVGLATATKMLAAALFQQARGATCPNPLAHLQSEGEQEK